MKSRPVRKYVCMHCGETFETAGTRVKYCKVCAFVRNRIMSRFKVRYGSVKAARARIDRAFAEYKITEADREIVRRRSSAVVDPHPCLYCGRLVTTGGDYCKRCLREGYCYLHSETGRTNGWDKPTSRWRAPRKSRKARSQKIENGCKRVR